jgi:hypothetical protein
MGLTRYFTLIVFQPEVRMFVKNVIKCSRLRPNKKICVVPVTRPSLDFFFDNFQISGTFPSPTPVLVLVSTMAASLKETEPICNVLSLTFNKCDHLKETKSIIVPVINSRTFNDIFDEHHDFGLKNNQFERRETYCFNRFRPSLVSIGLVLSEEKIFGKVYDVRRTPSDGNSSPDPLGQVS